MFLVIIQNICEALIYTSFISYLINKYNYCGGFSLSLIYSISILSSSFGSIVLRNIYYRTWYAFFFCFITWIYATSAIILHFILEDDGILIAPANPILLKDIKKVKIAKLNLSALGTTFGCSFWLSIFTFSGSYLNLDYTIALAILGIILSIGILANKYKLHNIHKRARVFIGLCMIAIAFIIAGPLDFINISEFLQNFILKPLFLYGGIITVLYSGAADLLGCAITELGHNDYELVNDRMVGFFYPVNKFFSSFSYILMYFLSQNMERNYVIGCFSMIIALFAIVYEGYAHGLRNYLQKKRFEDDDPVFEYGNELISSEKKLIYSIDEDDV
ncbi:hypothetical protein SteCoe_1976 [Stentor coeruleus]|uniref:Uncharacterized protein n=1 Tax=Stentor coeruleus TaxID=5963 RepID=A0A1R2D0M4_9CILI|nr:hypothetical protein SteCoe_1976 [Stentor coeruleus]